jgi:hypothetical protein
VQGDPFQMGGTLVVKTGGEPAYFQRSRFAGDHPPARDIVKALRTASRATPAGRPVHKPAGQPD